MPVYVELVPSSKGEKLNEEAAKREQPPVIKQMRVTAINAAEILRNSDLYIRKPRPSAEPVLKGLSLEFEDMTDERLKVLIVQAGARLPKKTVTRTELIALAKDAVYGVVTVVNDNHPTQPVEGPRVAVDAPTDTPQD